jgi:hypothetical protein
MIFAMWALVMGGLIRAAAAPASTEVEAILPGDSLDSQKADYKFRPDQKMEVQDDWVTYWGEKPVEVQFLEFGPDILSRMTSPWFAVETSVGYSKIAPGSYLEMVLEYAPEQSGAPEKIFRVKAQEEKGPMALLGGSGDSGFQKVILPFDASAMKTHLDRIVLNLHLTGGYGTTFALRSQITQYLNAASLKAASKGGPIENTLTVRVTKGTNGTVFSVPGTPLSTIKEITELTHRNWGGNQIGRNPVLQVIQDETVPYPDVEPLVFSHLYLLNGGNWNLRRIIQSSTPGADGHVVWQLMNNGYETGTDPWVTRIGGYGSANDNLLVGFSILTAQDFVRSGEAPDTTSSSTLGYGAPGSMPSPLPTLASHFAIEGEIQYKAMPKGYLELMAGFTAEKPADTPPIWTIRTDADKGPLAAVNGSSDWRPFWLPMDTSQMSGQLQSLALRVGLSNKGTVSSQDGALYVRDLKLVQYPGGQFPASLLQGQSLPTPQILPGTTVPIALHVGFDDKGLVYTVGNDTPFHGYLWAWVQDTNRSFANLFPNRRRHFTVSYDPNVIFVDQANAAYEIMYNGCIIDNDIAVPPQIVIHARTGTLGTIYTMGGHDFTALDGTEPYNFKDRLMKIAYLFFRTTGGPSLVPVVVKVDDGVPSDDAKALLDAVRQAGFPDSDVSASLPAVHPTGETAPEVVRLQAEVDQLKKIAADAVYQEERAQGFNLRSYLLGILTVVLALVAAKGVSFLVHYLRQRHHERELRRIESLDG